MKERILFHILPTAKYFIIRKDFFIWRSHISFSLAPPPLLCKEKSREFHGLFLYIRVIRSSQEVVHGNVEIISNFYEFIYAGLALTSFIAAYSVLICI